MEGDIASAIEAEKPQIAALLSVVSDDAGNDASVPEMPSICSLPLLLIQARQLHQRGISPITVEVDQISGALTGLLDQLRAEDIDIAPVRSVAELQAHAGSAHHMLVIRSGLYLSEEMLESLLSQEAPFALTLPADAAIAGYERIDLNSYWAGIAMLPGQLLGSIGDLPDGYSLPSALLRHAIQSGIALTDGQKNIKNGDLILLSDDTAFQLAEEREYSRSANSLPHQPERFLLRPLASAVISVAGEKNRLASYLWPASAVLCLTLAALSFLPAAFSMMLIAIAIFYIKNTIENIERNTGSRFPFNQNAMLLGGLAMMSSWHMGSWIGLFAGTVFAGLFVAMQNLSISKFGSVFLLSPLLITTLFLAAASSGFFLEMQTGVVLLLILLLLFEGYYRERKQTELKPF